MKLQKSLIAIIALFIFALSANAQLQYRRAADLDGDGKADMTSIRRYDFSSTATGWYTFNSSNGSYRGLQWGVAEEKHYFTADFDGDGKGDIGVARYEGNTIRWYIRRSQNGAMQTAAFGGLVNDRNRWDRVLPGDYDGDGKADIAVVRFNFTDGIPQATSLSWYWISSQTGQVNARTYNTYGGYYYCFPVNGDFDGDRKTDFAHTCINQNSDTFARVWDIVNSSTGAHSVYRFGLSNSDYPVAADYDGDGKTDVAVVRMPRTSGNRSYSWYILRSTDGALQSATFGGVFPADNFVDQPVAADYDGDGKTDIAVRRFKDVNAQNPYYPSYYYVLQSSNGAVTGTQWGYSYDLSSNCLFFNSGLSTYFVSEQSL